MKVNGLDINVIKKKIKNIHLYVKPPYGDVELTCPENYSDESIELFVRSKLGWIQKRKSEFASQLRQTKRQYVSGETVYLFGKQYYLKVKPIAQNYDIQIDGDNIIFCVRKDSTTTQKREHFNDWYRKALKDVLNRLVPKWENITGLKCSSYKIVNMRSQWGSCDSNNKSIIFNLKLAKKDIACIEYVILHELTHIIEPSHNKVFTQFVEKHMPSWMVVKDQLNNSILEDYDE